MQFVGKPSKIFDITRSLEEVYVIQYVQKWTMMWPEMHFTRASNVKL